MFKRITVCVATIVFVTVILALIVNNTPANSVASPTPIPGGTSKVAITTPQGTSATATTVPQISATPQNTPVPTPLPTVSITSDPSAIPEAEPDKNKWNLYYDELDDFEKKVYRVINADINNIEMNCDHIVLPPFEDNDITGWNYGEYTDKVNRALYAFSCDNPQYFWLYENMGQSFTYIDDQSHQYYTCVEFSPYNGSWYLSDYSSYADVQARKAEYETAFKKAYQKMIGTDFDKIKYAHDWIVEHSTYNYYVATGKNDRASEEAWTAVSVFSPEGRQAYDPVCKAYADAFKAFCDAAGIKCAVIVGDAGGGKHAWNLVEVNGKLYFLDATWDDTESDTLSYKYFLAGEKTFFKDHTVNMKNNFVCPAANKKDYQ